MLYLFTLSVNVAEVSSFMLDFLMQQKEVNVMNVDKNNKSLLELRVYKATLTIQQSNQIDQKLGWKSPLWLLYHSDVHFTPKYIIF